MKAYLRVLDSEGVVAGAARVLAESLLPLSRLHLLRLLRLLRLCEVAWVAEWNGSSPRMRQLVACGGAIRVRGAAHALPRANILPCGTVVLVVVKCRALGLVCRVFGGTDARNVHSAARGHRARTVRRRGGNGG